MNQRGGVMTADNVPPDCCANGGNLKGVRAARVALRRGESWPGDIDPVPNLDEVSLPDEGPQTRRCQPSGAPLGGGTDSKLTKSPRLTTYRHILRCSRLRMSPCR
jgi:hypothetical protein